MYNDHLKSDESFGITLYYDRKRYNVRLYMYIYI